MQKQTVEFTVETKGNVVQNIGKSVIYQPETNFKGGTVKFYEDKPKQKSD